MSATTETDEQTVTPSRNTITRCSVARRCKEFYLRRLERTEKMRRRWSVCTTEDKEISSIQTSTVESEQIENEENVNDLKFEQKKWKSNLDIAMNCLRQEITSLISQDNDLFQKLLKLHDSIAELRERQNSVMLTCLSENSRSPSLESLSDTDQAMSPMSTLSSCSSQSESSPGFCEQRRKSSNNSCLRCRTGSKGAPPQRHRAVSYISLNTTDDIDSYDSGVHLQGCHSDSDHEIFV